jgi:hypothetical protein
MKNAFNFAATTLGGVGTFIFGIGTITELLGATPGRNGFDPGATMLAASFLAFSVALLAAGIYGQRKAAKNNTEENPADKPQDPQP